MSVDSQRTEPLMVAGFTKNTIRDGQREYVDNLPDPDYKYVDALEDVSKGLSDDVVVHDVRGYIALHGVHRRVLGLKKGNLVPGLRFLHDSNAEPVFSAGPVRVLPGNKQRVAITGTVRGELGIEKFQQSDVVGITVELSRDPDGVIVLTRTDVQKTMADYLDSFNK